MMDCLQNFSASKAISKIKKQTDVFYNSLKNKGAYIWGTGVFGQYVKEQLRKNGYVFRGYIDNNCSKHSIDNKIYAPDYLQPSDNVIIASIYYYDIKHQIEERNNNVISIYYETLALIYSEFEIFYKGFINYIAEVEANSEKYRNVYGILSDNLSKQILDCLLGYRMSMDVEYLHQAKELSEREGEQDFDNVVTSRINSETVFLDVGGYDGFTTEQFIKKFKKYRKIFYFEPDHESMEISKKRLEQYKNINYVEAGAGGGGLKLLMQKERVQELSVTKGM